MIAIRDQVELVHLERIHRAGAMMGARGLEVSAWLQKIFLNFASHAETT